MGSTLRLHDHSYSNRKHRKISPVDFLIIGQQLLAGKHTIRKVTIVDSATFWYIFAVNFSQIKWFMELNWICVLQRCHCMHLWSTFVIFTLPHTMQYRMFCAAELMSYPYISATHQKSTQCLLRAISSESCSSHCRNILVRHYGMWCGEITIMVNVCMCSVTIWSCSTSIVCKLYVFCLCPKACWKWLNELSSVSYEHMLIIILSIVVHNFSVLYM